MLNVIYCGTIDECSRFSFCCLRSTLFSLQTTLPQSIAAGQTTGKDNTTLLIQSRTFI